MRSVRGICGAALLAVVIAAGAGATAPADSVKILVPEDVKEELADLEARLPNLELVSASTPEETLKAVVECDAIAGMPYGQNAAEILRAGKKLRWVHSNSAGVENIVFLAEMQSSGIMLTNAKIIQGPEIADHAFALLLTQTRNLKQYNRVMTDGWMEREDTALPIIELRGKTMLIIGLGGIGTQVAQRAAAFEMRVLAVDPKDMPLNRNVEYVGKPDELNRLLPEADVVVSSVPHTPASEGMLGKEQFALMKEGVYVINVSRGKIVDTEALVAALQSGKVRAAGLDVTDPEPLPDGHPLWEMANVTITPHIATVSDNVNERRVSLIRTNIERFVAGRPLINVVNQGVGF